MIAQTLIRRKSYGQRVAFFAKSSEHHTIVKRIIFLTLGVIAGFSGANLEAAKQAGTSSDQVPAADLKELNARVNGLPGLTGYWQVNGKTKRRSTR